MRQKQNVTENNKIESCAMTKDQMIELMEKINKGRKDNLESRRSALNTLVGAFPVGERYLRLCLWMNYILMNLISGHYRIM